MAANKEEFAGRSSHMWDRELVLAPLLIAPAILYIVVLVGAPFFLAIYYSLSDATTGSQSLHFVGLSNFQAVLKDPVFRKSLINTFIFTLVSQALVLVLAKVLALALLKDFRGKWLVKFLILLPWTAPIALGTIGWMWMLDSIFSPIDWLYDTWVSLVHPMLSSGPIPISTGWGCRAWPCSPLSWSTPGGCSPWRR